MVLTFSYLANKKTYRCIASKNGKMLLQYLLKQWGCMSMSNVRCCCITYWHTGSFCTPESSGRANPWQRASVYSDATQSQLLRLCSLGPPLLRIKDPFSHQMASGATPRSSLWPPRDTNIVIDRLSGVLKLGHIPSTWPIKQQAVNAIQGNNGCLCSDPHKTHNLDYI